MTLKFLPRHVLLVFVLAFGFIGHWSLSADPIDQAKYLEVLQSAFRRIIPPQERDPLARLMGAVHRGAEGRTIVEQVLKDHRATTLKSYLQEIDGILNHRRIPLNDAERRFQEGKATLSEIDDYRRQYSQDRLTVSELVVLIHFYQSLDVRENQLIKMRGLRRVNAETPRIALGVTKFPFIEVREHGKDLPLISMTAGRQNDWRDVYKLFQTYGKAYEFAQLWGQMVNQNSGNKRFRHLETFEERFLWEVRSWAVTRGEPLKARDLLVAYLSNFASNTLLDRVGDDPKKWRRAERSQVEGKLAEFISYLARTENRYQLRRFFAEGVLPSHFPKETESKQLTRALLLFRTAGQVKSLEMCLKALSARPKY